MNQGQKKQIIEKVRKYVEADQAQDFSGHDYWHSWRVWNLARHLAKSEKADKFVVELAALLHDCDDWKFNDGDLDGGPKEAGKLLKKLGVDQDRIDKVKDIIRHISFKGEGVKPEPMSPEGEIVQDADRLDSIGAIGAARTFAYGGAMDRPIHDPNQKVAHFRSFAQYRHNHSSSINIFYEKMLLAKDQLHTKEAKRIATKRHKFLEKYLEQFFDEWGMVDCMKQ